MRRGAAGGNVITSRTGLVRAAGAREPRAATGASANESEKRTWATSLWTLLPVMAPAMP